MRIRGIKPIRQRKTLKTEVEKGEKEEIVFADQSELSGVATKGEKKRHSLTNAN